ncbi:MAG: hypothetical protein N2554_03065 [Fimbriimonadales bacterium]|nr:hypothetical protein [Fimbriimonadales bacterium]
MMRGLLWSFGTACLLSYAGAQQPFTYQGFLKDGGNPANGAYDFEFRLFTAASGGSQVGSTVPINDLNVQNGLFTVELNFGIVWSGPDRFLEIRVRPGASTGAFTTLSPRVKVNPTPYSHFALLAPWSGLSGVPAGFADGIDNDTLYSAGAGLQLSGTTFSIATGGVSTSMLADNAVNNAKLANDAASLSKVSGNLMHSTGTRIGIGTTAPTTNLHVFRGASGATPSSASVIVAEHSANAYINLLTPNANESGILFGNPSNSAAGGIVYNSGNANGLQFRTNGNFTRMVITDVGRVGIGTLTPPAQLTVDGALNVDPLRVRTEDSGGVATTRLVVTAAGRVGIGTPTPPAQLTVDGALNVDPLRVRTEDSSGNAIARLVVTAAGNVGIGTTAPDQRLVVNGTAKVDVLQIVGADVAEKFPGLGDAEPGMVVEIDPDNPGHLRKARGAYNRRVVGVVSGANKLPAGAILGHLEGSESHTPIAISGRVWVYADATKHAIEPGDLLTTAEKPGYAMKARDPRKSHGAILGKAMTRLEKGKTGLVLVVVNLQ